ncbi:pteridine reductase [Coralloluteibacterium stylophorae]|uniref:Pteridine reductase n=1 Tax=Coralloluteibacterium stylophorae TaxID=1776034 RepID=A0A8J7VSC3_9GAMM|nr:pteridine reductase [Coralloluteibacterium stylophorae]MBS7458049.1 pteridine reductase [Coralloluteibacterium stylophorae]
MSDRPVAFVTGAARRVGAAIARALHAAGYDLALHCRNSRADLDALVAELEGVRGGSTLALQAELGDADALPGLVEAALARFGRIDALVNNASAFYPTPVGTATPAQWDELFAANARAPFFLAQAAAPHLRAARGAILNMADVYAERPLPQHTLYCMAKAALVMLTRSLAQELGPEVRVNAIAPGNVLWSTNEVKVETAELLAARTALARQGSPDDIAAAALYLLRDARYTTGVVLPVDGGRLLHI